MKKTSLFLALTLVIACSDDNKKSKPKGGDETTRSQAQCPGDGVLVINDEGTALAGAQVLIGQSVNSPFVGNFVVTNANGMAARPAGWTMFAAVTGQAPGYVRTTYFDRDPGSCVTMVLHKPSVVPTLELSGQAIDNKVISYDGFADFGLVISAITRRDLLAFDISKVISTQMDRLSVFGQSVEIPSNVTIPLQTENYIFPITLEKPSYRLYFGNKQTQKVFAAKGRFPFKKTIDNIRAKKKFYDLLNDFTLVSGVVRDLPVAQGQNLPVNEVAFAGKRGFKAPALGSGEILMALAAFDVNGSMVPTDVKRLQSNETLNLSVNPSAPALAVGVLKNEAEFDMGSGGTDRLSAVILPFNAPVNPSFLSLIPNPRVVNGDLQMARPRSVNGVHELATLAILSDVQDIPLGSTMIPFLSHQWEVYAPRWVDQMDLPTWPSSFAQELKVDPIGAKKRWEVTFIGSQLKDMAEMGQPVIDAATHITHSSMDF